MSIAALVAAACSGSSGGNGAGGTGGVSGAGPATGGSAGRGGAAGRGSNAGSGGTIGRAGSAGRGGGSSGTAGTGGEGEAGGEAGAGSGGGGGSAGTGGASCFADGADPGECTPWTECDPGEYVVSEGTRTVDRDCAACPIGSFSLSDNASECSTWTECVAGEYVSQIGTRRRDRVCSECPEATMSTGPNATECVPWTVCEAGEYVSLAGTGTADRQCTPCPAETFSADDNLDACTAWAVCEQGDYVTAEPSPTANRECATCVGGYNLVQNSPNCTTWTACDAGQYVSVQGSPTNDQTCSACPDFTFSTGTNAAQCDPFTPCTPGEYLTTTGTSTTDQECTACPGGRTSLGLDAHRCSPAQVAAGAWHSCMLSVDGDVKCWGWGSGGGLGYGNGDSIGDDEAPSTIGNVSIGGAVMQLAAGNGYNCALLVNGSVRCWGFNDSGQLGYGNGSFIGDNELPSSAGDVTVGGTVKQLAAGTFHTCALLSDGAVRCWGNNSTGQLGYANTSNVGDNETPASAGNVDVGGTVEQVVAGNNHTCALLIDGSVRCWGWGGYGQLGYGNTSDIGDNEPPASAGSVDVGGRVIQLVAGHYHTCALLRDGNVRCWGLNDAGQLGYGNLSTIGDSETPASAGNVTVGGVVLQLAAGSAHTCALLQGGAVRCWGRYNDGRLGYAVPLDIGDNETPASAGNVDIGGTAVQITAGYSHTCALLTGDDVKCWGLNDHGQLGYGSMDTVGDNEVPSAMGVVPYR